MTAAVMSPAGQVKPVERKLRLKQSVCRWCYSKIPVEDFAKECARLNVQSVDLADPKEWPVYKKFGLVPTMIGGGTTIPDGFNRKENHEGISARFREAVNRGVENGAPSIIVFSGNRRGMSDEEGLDNCIIGLKQVMPLAEDKNLLVCMELLNSKVDHKDYMCDHTKWGVELVSASAHRISNCCMTFTTCRSWRGMSSERSRTTFNTSDTCTPAATPAEMRSTSLRS